MIVAAPPQPGAGVAAMDEAATAAAIGRSTHNTELRGSTASADGRSPASLRQLLSGARP